MAVQLAGRSLATSRGRERNRALALLRHVDFLLVGAAVLLSLIGVVMVYSATRVQLAAQGIDPHYYLKRQAIWIVCGLAVMTVVALVDYQRLARLAYAGYVIAILSLVAVLSHRLGSSQYGSQRWFNLGPLEVQPSELAVLALILVTASYCSRQPVMTARHLVVVSAVAGVPILLVYKQPDLGTAIIMGVVLAAMLVCAGVRVRYLAFMTLLSLIGVIAAFQLGLLHSYQLSRLTSFLHPGTGTGSLSSANYNFTMAKTTIASGGLTGSGIGHGAATNGGYVPQQYTDFIFTAVGEQLGFAGSALVIGLFGVIALRMLRAAQTARDPLGRLLCAGALAFLAFSVFQNIGMNIGLMPIAGIPLPFLSYGGTALMVFFATVGLVLNVEMRRMARR